jgi:5-methylcytosine-specific restriction endonuclease McrA
VSVTCTDHYQMGKHDHLYKTNTWRAMRREQLYKSPLCVYCLDLGVTEPANIADHIIPHRGSHERFYDALNLQSLCKHCHDSVKSREEHYGESIGCDVNGLPRNKKYW